MQSIDWEALARRVGALTEEHEYGSSDAARKALAFLLGEANIRQAVEHYVAFKPGAEFTRHVLWLLHPQTAIEYCYYIYRSERNIEERRAAIELLRVVGDARILRWIEEFLADEDEGIQMSGAGALDQLLWSQLVDEEEAQELLELTKNHKNPQVRETYTFVSGYLRDRQRQEQILEEHFRKEA